VVSSICIYLEFGTEIGFESPLIYLLQICLWGNQEWVEDPSNQILLFARNRIRMSLRDSSSCELTEMIALMV
jgi:hypothetical protein